MKSDISRCSWRNARYEPAVSRPADKGISEPRRICKGRPLIYGILYTWYGYFRRIKNNVIGNLFPLRIQHFIACTSLRELSDLCTARLRCIPAFEIVSRNDQILESESFFRIIDGLVLVFYRLLLQIIVVIADIVGDPVGCLYCGSVGYYRQCEILLFDCSFVILCLNTDVVFSSLFRFDIDNVVGIIVLFCDPLAVRCSFIEYRIVIEAGASLCRADDLYLATELYGRRGNGRGIEKS